MSREAVKEQMLKYGFLAPDMTVTEFVEDCLPSVTPKKQPEIIPCDYVKACNEATNYKMISAVSYLEVLEELKKHGYVLVNTMKEGPC